MSKDLNLRRENSPASVRILSSSMKILLTPLYDLCKPSYTLPLIVLLNETIVLTFTHCFICTVTEIRILVMRGCFEVTRVENESFASLERPLGLERLAMFIFHPSDLKTTSNTRIHFRHSINETMSGGQYFF